MDKPEQLSSGFFIVCILRQYYTGTPVFKRMKTHTLLAALLLTLTFNAQTPTGKWITSNAGEQVGIYAQTIGPDGYIYYCGAYTPTSGGERMYFAKSDTSGNMIWEKYLDSVFLDAVEIAVDEHSIYLAGYQNVLRFDTDGNFIWRKLIDVQTPVYVNDVMTDESGGCVVAGMRYIPALPKKSAYIVKFDSTGATVWDKEMFWSGYNTCFFYSLTKDNSNNVYACGGAGMGFNPSDEGTVAKFSSSGTLLWTRIIDIDTNTSVAFYQCDFHNNEITLAGSAYPGIPDVPILFVRLDTLGNGFYGTVLPNDSANQFVINSIYCTPYNTLIVTGGKLNGAVYEGVLIEFDYNFSFIRGISTPATTDITGFSMLNNKTYICGAVYFGNAASFRGLSDNSWSFGCGFVSLDADINYVSVNYGMLIDSTGSVAIIDSHAVVQNTSVQYSSCDNLAGVIEPVTNEYTIYPNPASECLFVTFKEALSAPEVLSIYNHKGQVVQTHAVNQGVSGLQINIAELAAGTYTVRMQSGLAQPFVVIH